MERFVHPKIQELEALLKRGDVDSERAKRVGEAVGLGLCETKHQCTTLYVQQAAADESNANKNPRHGRR